MPFALVAVTLLLLGSAYGVVYASIEMSEDNAEDAADELMSIGDGIDDTKKYVESSLGRIISELGRAETGGTLTDRLRSFDGRVSSWMSSTFPMKDRGITASLVDYDIDLGVENLRLSSGDALADDSRASYLKATGTVTVDYISSAGTTQKTLQISADGTSGLPFIVESATRFELSSSGDASALTQLMTYQLSSLAQQRVLNGYGALSEGGERGTRSILTEKDVNDAFSNALKIIETLCFRSNGENDGDIVSADGVDAADLILTPNGYYEIDLSTVYSQTLLSLLDLILLRWCDLFFGKEILEVIDGVKDAFRNTINALSQFFGGKGEEMNAVPYLKDVITNSGMDSESMRRLFSDPSFEIKVSGTDYVDVDGTVIRIDDFSVSAEYPNADLFGWHGWNDFVKRYHGDRNDTMETMRNVLKSVAVGISSDFGTVRVHADEFDGESFADGFSRSLTDALNSKWSETLRVFEGGIRSETISDPLFVAMFDEIESNSDAIFGISSFSDGMRSEVEAGIRSHISEKYGSILDESVIADMVDGVMSSGQTDAAVSTLNEAAENRMDVFEEMLTDVPKSNRSLIKDAMAETGKMAFGQLNVFDKIKGTSSAMCQEMIGNLEMNSRSGVIDLSGEDRFLLYDDDMNHYEEFVSISDEYRTSVKIVTPDDNTGKCCHTVGIEEIGLTPYTSVFTVKFKADVRYELRSTSFILDAIGSYDSAMSDGFAVDTVLDIPCVSGWALAGVEYPSSTNILEELWNLLLKAISPLLDPLREIYGAIEDLFDMCSTAIMEVSAYVSDLVTRFYETVSRPLEILQGYVDDGLSETLSWIVKCFDIGLAKQSVTFCIFGLNLTVETKLATLLKDTKTLLKLTLAGCVGDTKFKAFAEIRENKKDGYMVRGGGSLDGKEWNLSMTIDPLMKFGKRLVTANGTIRGVDFDVTMPELVQYDEFEAKVSDIPGVGALLSNIPLPIPGMKGTIDMGFDLKYNLPVGTGIMINEFESNPEGDDSGAEWVEIYNATSRPVSLSGYMLVPNSNESKATVITGTTVGAWDRTVITFDKQCLNNTKNGKFGGERLTLYDPEGNKVDETPWKKDTYNNSLTWQRSADGSSKWELLEGTPEGKNGGVIKTGAFVKTFVIDCLAKAGEAAFDELGNHLTSVDDISRLLQRTLELFIEYTIEKIADCIVSASVFIELEITDYTESQHNGIRLSLEMDSNLVREGIKWLIGQTGMLADMMGGASCDDPVDLLCENIYVRSTVYTGIGAPRFLNNAAGTTVTVGLSAAVNISGICGLFGKEQGEWKAEIGIVMEDIPSSIVPKMLKADDSKKTDLWLMRFSFGSAS